MKDEARQIGAKPWRILDDRKRTKATLVWVMDVNGKLLFASKPTWARIAVKAVNEQRG
jgi:hypothetical protein